MQTDYFSFLISYTFYNIRKPLWSKKRGDQIIIFIFIAVQLKSLKGKHITYLKSQKNPED